MERINKQRVFNFYNRKNKWLGLVDYKTLTFSIVYAIILFKIIFNFNFSYSLKIYLYINLMLPIIIFIILNIQEESIIDKLKIIIIYLASKKIYANCKVHTYSKVIYTKNVEK